MIKTTHLPVALRGLFCSLGVIAAASALTGCQDEDYGFTKQEVSDAVYDRNFIAEFGDISPEQSWDLSSYATQKRSTVTAEDAQSFGALTRSVYEQNPEFIQGKMTYMDDWFDVPNNMLEAFLSNLKEGENNIQKKNPNAEMGFSFDASNEEFYFVPVFVGKSGIASELHMVVKNTNETYDKCIWSKSERIQKIPNGQIGWQNMVGTMDYWLIKDDRANTMDADYIHAQPIKFDFTGMEAEVSFYLHITTGHLDYATRNGNEHDRNTENASSGGEANLAFTGMKVLSSSEKFCVLDPNIFHLDNEIITRFNCSKAYMIGCEDAISPNDWGKPFTRKTSAGDETFSMNSNKYSYTDKNGTQRSVDRWVGDDDINDLVFMILARDLKVKPRTEKISKRYLFEDMGSVVDWDFNDVVVDIYQEKTNGVVTSQYAYLRHRCGTTPFQIKVGDKVLDFPVNSTEKSNGFIAGKQSDRLSSEFGDNSRVDLSQLGNPWNPETNNVSITVIPRDIYENQLQGTSSTEVNIGYFIHEYGRTETFPRNGDVPRIIAVDTDFGWTREDVNINSDSWNSYDLTVNINTDQQSSGQTTAGGSVDGLLNVTTQSPNVGHYMKGSTNRTANLTAVSNSKYQFVNWTGSGIPSGKENDASISIPVNNNLNITANFRYAGDINRNGTYNLTWNKDSKNQDKGNVVAKIGTPETLGAEVASGTTSHKKGEVVTLTATPTDDNYGFLYWKDANGNIDRRQTITVGGSDLNLTAYFRQKWTLNLNLSNTDKATEWDKVSFTINGTTKNPNNNGQTSFTVLEDEDILVTASSSRVNGEWNAMFDYNIGNYTKPDIHNGTETSLGKLDYNNKTYVVDVRYQVQGNAGVMNNGKFSGDSSVGTVVLYVNGTSVKDAEGNDSHEGWLHYNTNFEFRATAKDGYEFVEWSGKNNTTTTLSDTNNGNNGTYYVNGVFRPATKKHTLTLKLNQNADQDENISIWINGTQATKSSDGKSYSAQVETGTQLTITAQHNNYTADWNKTYAKFKLSDGTILENGVAKTLNNWMPDYDLEIPISSISYYVSVVVKLNGNVINDFSNICNVTIDNKTENPTYLEENKQVNFAVSPKNGDSFYGYNWMGWKSGDWTSTDRTISSHNNSRALILDALFEESEITYGVLGYGDGTDITWKTIENANDLVNITNLLTSTKRTLELNFNSSPNDVSVSIWLFDDEDQQFKIKACGENGVKINNNKVTLTLEESEVTQYKKTKKIILQAWKPNNSGSSALLKSVNLLKTN